MEQSKRNVPSALRKVLQIDADLTNKFCLRVNNFLPLRALKIHYKILEISCHGIPWFAGWIAFIMWMNSPDLYQMQTNFLLGLFVDIMAVCMLKAYCRRRRPSTNTPDMFAVFGPDIYSFPSGHASRAAFIVHFFTMLYPLPIILYPPMLAWSTSVCLSRVLLQRHHLLDIFGGVFLGLLEGCLIGAIWLSHGACDSFLGLFMDVMPEDEP